MGGIHIHFFKWQELGNAKGHALVEQGWRLLRHHFWGGQFVAVGDIRGTNIFTTHNAREWTGIATPANLDALY